MWENVFYYLRNKHLKPSITRPKQSIRFFCTNLTFANFQISHLFLSIFPKQIRSFSVLNNIISSSMELRFENLEHTKFTSLMKIHTIYLTFPYSLDSFYKLILKRLYNVQVSLKKVPSHTITYSNTLKKEPKTSSTHTTLRCIKVYTISWEWDRGREKKNPKEYIQ